MEYIIHLLSTRFLTCQRGSKIAGYMISYISLLQRYGDNGDKRDQVCGSLEYTRKKNAILRIGGQNPVSLSRWN